MYREYQSGITLKANGTYYLRLLTKEMTQNIKLPTIFIESAKSHILFYSTVLSSVQFNGLLHWTLLRSSIQKQKAAACCHFRIVI